MQGLMMLMFLLLSINFVPSYQFYKDCRSVECGGMVIIFPFYVAGRQPSYCGYPGFRVSCKNNLPLLNLSGDTYIIKNISYSDQSIQIVNSAFFPSTFECISITSVHNLTLTNSAPLEFISKRNEIVLLQDCSAEALQSMSKIMCKNNSYGNSLAAVYDKDLKRKEVAGECRWAVSLPYEVSGASKMEDKMREGFALKWRCSFMCLSCHMSGGRCVYNQTTLDFQCLCFELFYTREKNCLTSEEERMTMWVGVVTIGSVLGAVLIILICCTRLCIRIIKSIIKHAKMRRRAAHGNRNVEDFIRSQESMAPKRYTYNEIKKMTMSFREKLGEGGFSVVYKGKLLDGRLVAVKMLKQSKGDAQDFINEVASISRTNHVNVVTFLGFCFEGRKRGLVYEFMPNGSLEKFTRAGANGSQLLSWETLFQIALSIARGLEYLHIGCNTRILHFDIKPHNILLDESFCPKISDFGLAKLCPQTEQSQTSMSIARGTIGYIAPEVFYRNFGHASHKSDVYSYGMMILEVIGCRENANDHIDTSSSEYFPNWIYRQLNLEEELLGEAIMDNEEKGLQRKMILVSLWCIQAIPSSRPSMGRVVQMLEGSLESIQVPPIPILSSPPMPQVESSGSFTITTTNDSSSERIRKQVPTKKNE